MRHISIVIWFLCCFLACDKHSSSTSRSQDYGPFNAGKSVYNTVEFSVKQGTNGKEKVNALRSSSAFSGVTQGSTHQEQIISGVNSVVEGHDVTNPEREISRASQDNAKLVRTIYDLIREGTLPQFTDVLADMLKELAKDESNIQVLTDFLNTRSGLEPRVYVGFLKKVLNYPNSEALFKAIARIIQQNPTFLKNVFQLLHGCLTTLTPSEETLAFLKMLGQEIPTVSQIPLGNPVWIAYLDSNCNPQVRSDNATGTLYTPFVDENHDGVCDVDGQSRPVDSNGLALDIPAFGIRGYVDGHGQVLITRDAMGRALAPNGEPVFAYYNAKKTVLGILLLGLGQAIRDGMVKDGIKFSAVAFLPKKEYTDAEGTYFGYSDESDILQAALGLIDVLKKKSTLQLLHGFAMLSNKKIETTRKFLIGFGKMVCIVRDTPVEDPQQIMMLMMQIMLGGMVPELKEAISEMGEIQIPVGENETMPMSLFFTNWFGENIEVLATNFMWPMKKGLLKVIQTCPDDPQLAERFYQKFVDWVTGDIEERKIAAVVPIVLQAIVEYVSTDTENKVERIKKGLKASVSSRLFVNMIDNLILYGNSEDAKIVCEAVLYYLTPQENPENDVYGCLACCAGILDFKPYITAKIRLLNMIGQLLNPKLPVVMNLLRVLGKLISVDNAQLCLRSARAAVSECKLYNLAPVVMFGHAALAVYRVDYGNKCTHEQILPDDVRNILHSIQDALSNPRGLLKKIYEVLGNKRD